MTVTYNPDICSRALERLRSNAAALDELDVQQLAIWGGDHLVRDALNARHAALFPAPPVTAPAPRQGATKGGLSEQSMDAIATAIVTFVGEALAPISKRLDHLEAVEQDRGKGVSGVRWRGVVKRTETYRSGELVPHDGSLWVVLAPETAQVPARPPEGQVAAYQLIVKQGAVPK